MQMTLLPQCELPPAYTRGAATSGVEATMTAGRSSTPETTDLILLPVCPSQRDTHQYKRSKATAFRERS